MAIPTPNSRAGSLQHPTSCKTEMPLLALLALLWGASYLFIKVAVNEIPPVTLIALRVLGAAVFLLLVMRLRAQALPRGLIAWRMLLVQAFLNSIGAWTVLAWGQRHVDAGLASVLNSTSPIFVYLFTAAITRHESLGGRKLMGTAIGIVVGVTLIIGTDALSGLGTQVAGQLACLIGAALYAGAAIYGKRFGHISPLATATGTMICAALILVPLALIIDQPWTAPAISKGSCGHGSVVGLLHGDCAPDLFPAGAEHRIDGRCQSKLSEGSDRRRAWHAGSGRNHERRGGLGAGCRTGRCRADQLAGADAQVSDAEARLYGSRHLG